MTPEAVARIKINKLLEAAGWRFFGDGTGPSAWHWTTRSEAPGAPDPLARARSRLASRPSFRRVMGVVEVEQPNRLNESLVA